MTDTDPEACATPLADLRRSALAHYDEISAQAHHWSSVIPRAINFYFDAEEAKAMPDPTPPAAPRPCECASAATAGSGRDREVTRFAR
jgi:hypothetical protein